MNTTLSLLTATITRMHLVYFCQSTKQTETNKDVVLYIYVHNVFQLTPKR